MSHRHPHKVLNLKDLVEYVDHAKRYMRNLPGRARLPGMTHDLSGEEARAVCYLEAALLLLGIPAEDFMVRFDLPDSDIIDD